MREERLAAHDSVVGALEVGLKQHEHFDHEDFISSTMIMVATRSTVELQQLAHLLRTGTEFVREIATLRAADAEEILGLVDQALTIADRLDEIASRPHLSN